MDLASLVQSILRQPGDFVGTVTVKVHPDYEYVLDVQTMQRERKAFAQHLARIPNIDGGLSWKLLAPYTNGNGSLAMATIAVGHALGLWPLIPDPDSSPGIFRSKGSMLPQTGVISSWPRWSGVTVTGDGFPKVEAEKQAEDTNTFPEATVADPDEPPGLAGFLQQFG